MQLKNIIRKTELQLMSIRSKHWKNTSCSLGINMAKIQLTSVVNQKWEMENYDLTQDMCTCFLFPCVILSLLLYYLYMLYVSIQTNTVDFIFKYIKEKNPLSFHNFSNLSRECYEDREFWPWNSWIIHISPTTDTDNVLKTVLRVYNTFFTMFFNSQNTSINQSLWSNFQPFW